MYSPVCLLDRQDPRTDPWGQDHREQERGGNLPLVIPMTQVGLGGNHHQGMKGKILDRLEGGIHLDLLVRTAHCLQGMARLDKGQREHQDQRGTVLLGKEPGLPVAVQEFLQMDTAQGTVQAPLDPRETDPELQEQEDIVQVLRGQQGSHQVLREAPGIAPGIAPVLRDLRGTGTAPELLGQKSHR